jgi:hypothetical protein
VSSSRQNLEIGPGFCVEFGDDVATEYGKKF